MIDKTLGTVQGLITDMCRECMVGKRGICEDARIMNDHTLSCMMTRIKDRMQGKTW